MNKNERIRHLLENKLGLDYVSSSLAEDIIQIAVEGHISESEMQIQTLEDTLESVEARLKRVERELGIKIV